MEIDQVQIALEQYFATNFVGWPIEFENDPIVARSDPYVRFSVQWGPSMPSLDSSYKRMTGVAYAVCRTPKGTGSILPTQMANAAAKVLELRQVGGVNLSSADVTNLGLLGDQLQIDAGWTQMNVAVPFWFDSYVV